MHLCRFGFKDNYKTWTSHGEGLVNSHGEGRHDEGFGEIDNMDEMLAGLDA
jgi:hypothetical protein